MDQVPEDVGAAPPPAAGSIVVGHDGSRGADLALGEALEIARALGRPLAVVRTWTLVTAPRPPGASFGYVSGFDEYATSTRRSLEDDTRPQVDRYPALAVELHIVHGEPSRYLVGISGDARMLVVGARGLGGLSGLLLGSVSEQCVRHARCPVLVTRAPHSR